MLIQCDQCHSKYKITIKKIPTKPVNFRCGKCQHTIVIPPEKLQADLPPAETKPAPAPETPPPAPVAPVPPPAPGEGSSSDTVQLSCLKCGAEFVKPKDEKSRLCYQCRIDDIVHKIKDKYGVAGEDTLAGIKSKYTFRTADGLLLGPIKLKTVAVLVREKRLQGQEEVSKDGGEFRPLIEFEEVRKLFPDLAEAKPAPAARPEAPETHEEEIDLGLDEPAPEPAPPAEGPVVKFETVKTPEPPQEKPKPAPPPPPPKAPPPRPKAPPAPPAPAPDVSRYKIRYPDGLLLGPIRLMAVEDLVAAGNLTGQEEVQKDNGPWKLFLDFPELKALIKSGEEIEDDEIVELTDLLEEAN